MIPCGKLENAKEFDGSRGNVGKLTRGAWNNSEKSGHGERFIAPSQLWICQYVVAS